VFRRWRPASERRDMVGVAVGVGVSVGVGVGVGVDSLCNVTPGLFGVERGEEVSRQWAVGNCQRELAAGSG
jgi:hypothetical protein